jgi:hypothetical protein
MRYYGAITGGCSIISQNSVQKPEENQYVQCTLYGKMKADEDRLRHQKSPASYGKGRVGTHAK